MFCFKRIYIYFTIQIIPAQTEKERVKERKREKQILGKTQGIVKAHIKNMILYRDKVFKKYVYRKQQEKFPSPHILCCRTQERQKKQKMMNSIHSILIYKRK